MTDARLAALAITARDMEAEARAHWDAVAGGDDGQEYVSAQAAVRQAVALRRVLEQWIVARATRAPASAR